MVKRNRLTTPRVLFLIGVVLATPALAVWVSQYQRFAPNLLLFSVTLTGFATGILLWWRNSAPPQGARIRNLTAPHITQVAQLAIRQFNRRVMGGINDTQLAELWLFYECWLNLEDDARSRFSEELSMTGIDMIRLGDALRAIDPP